jgi:hypothetical protein
VRVQIILPSCTAQQHESTTTPVFSQTRLAALEADALEAVARAETARRKATESRVQRRFMRSSFLVSTDDYRPKRDSGDLREPGLPRAVVD